MSPANERPLVPWLIGALVLVTAIVLGWRLIGDRGDAPAVDAAQTTPSERAAELDRTRAGKRDRVDLQLASKATISGIVRDLEGAPIASARVCGFADKTTLRGLGDARPVCVSSEADGHYRLEGLWPVPTSVEASAPTFIPGRWQARDDDGHLRERVRLIPGATVEGVDLLLQPGGVRVTGVVRDISGGEIEGALVIARGQGPRGSGLAVTMTDDVGGFELWTAPGWLSIAAIAEGYADGEVGGVAPGASIELFLTPESVLVGQVVHAQTKQPVADATVTLGGRRFGMDDRATRTDAEGWFRLDRLAPGTYKPIARADELYGEAAVQVPLGLGETSEPVQILAHPAFLVSGVVSVAGREDRRCPTGALTLSSPDSRLRTELDAEGVGELRGVLPGVYQVELRCDGYIAEDSYPPVEVVDASVTGLRWSVSEGLAIRGEVVDAAGSPVASVNVDADMLLTGDDPHARTTNNFGRTDDRGQFELSGLLPGRYEVSVAARGGRPGPEQPTTVELLAGADVNDLRVVLPATGQLRGRLIDTRGQGVAGIWISAVPVGSERGQSAQTDEAGAFSFDTLLPGPTRVGQNPRSNLRTPGTTDDDPQGQVVEIPVDETAEVELVVEAQVGVIRGRVVDEHGGPVADAFVDAERMTERAGANARAARQALRWSWGRKPMLTDPDGRFELDSLPEGVFLVSAHRKGGGEATLEQVALGTDIELVIATTGELGGAVVNPSGPPPERFRVVATDNAQGVVIGDGFFRTDGAWTLRELPPGSYSISASSTAGTAKLELTLGEGEQRVDLVLELENRVTIRGRIIDLDTREGIAGFEVNASGSGGGRRLGPGDFPGEVTNVTDADGRFELPGVASGRNRVFARLRTGGSDKPYDFAFGVREIQPTPAVQDIGEIEAIARRVERGKRPGELGYSIVEPDRAAAPEDIKIEVALVRPGGPAAAAGLEVGAVIESVDGHVIEGDTNRYRMLSEVPAGTTITLGLAGGETVKITAAAAQ
ncbi:carboxypeptidase regulatory-like domain-containing protein [Enhygromyxa salina]|uniref:Dioxygenase n=1 Tax=Enhygromyxa salina TaxID=215803 RepID=A0A2S9YXS2_9BACT|nr:carboxypeptidase regulatory-like domain-containing protein [Enhygromyxa salina]PRQ09893.1 Dioxygenase [Enhygromyxa salina]